MDTWTIVVGIFTIIGVVVTTALFMMSNIDKKIEEKINNPKFIKKLAEEVKLPFVIFDENNKILADYGAYQYLDRIETQKKDGELIAIRITPAAPELCVLLKTILELYTWKHSHPYSC